MCIYLCISKYRYALVVPIDTTYSAYLSASVLFLILSIKKNNSDRHPFHTFIPHLSVTSVIIIIPAVAYSTVLSCSLSFVLCPSPPFRFSNVVFTFCQVLSCEWVARRVIFPNQSEHEVPPFPFHGKLLSELSNSQSSVLYFASKAALSPVRARLIFNFAFSLVYEIWILCFVRECEN